MPKPTVKRDDAATVYVPNMLIAFIYNIKETTEGTQRNRWCAVQLTLVLKGIPLFGHYDIIGFFNTLLDSWNISYHCSKLWSDGWSQPTNPRFWKKWHVHPKMFYFKRDRIVKILYYMR